jgi:hypothetical protein
MMRHLVHIVSLLVTCAVPVAAQSSPPPQRAAAAATSQKANAPTQKAKKRVSPACAALKKKQQEEAQQKQATQKQATQKQKQAAPDAPAAATPSTMVSGPPSTVPAVAESPAPGAVNVPVPTLPSAAASFGADSGNASNANAGTSLASACADESDDAEADARFAAMARKHPTAVKIFSRINTTAPGWTLRADTIVDGSGIAGGGAYRREFTNDHTSFDLMGMASIRGYYLVQAGFTYTLPADRRVALLAAVRHESFPEEDFYGLGRDTLEREHTAYWRQGVDTIAAVTFSPADSFHVTGTAGLVDARVLSGRQGGVPTIEDRFNATGAPGLQLRTWSDFLHVGAGVDIDRTDNPIFPRGGRYRGSFTIYKALDDAIGRFTRVDIDLRHYQPIPHTERHVVAVRALLSSISSQDGAAVPFYFLPRLGGGTTLRSYGTSRLTDRNALAFNTEYRWLMLDRVQLIALIDLGDVAPTFTALRPSKFHSSIGTGMRYHIAGTFLAGLDAAHGHEGWTFIARLGHAF